MYVCNIAWNKTCMVHAGCVRGPNGPKTFMTFNQTNDERSCEYRDVEFICANEISVISSASGLSIAPTTIPSGTIL